MSPDYSSAQNTNKVIYPAIPIDCLINLCSKQAVSAPVALNIVGSRSQLETCRTSRQNYEAAMCHDLKRTVLSGTVFIGQRALLILRFPSDVKSKGVVFVMFTESRWEY